MKTKLFYFTLLAILLSFTKGYSQDDRWIYVAETEKHIVYYDSKTIKYENGNITLFTKWKNIEVEYYEYGEDAGKYVEYTIRKEKYFCKDYSRKLINVTYYFTDRTSTTTDFNYSDKTDIIPDSVGEIILLSVCK